MPGKFQLKTAKSGEIYFNLLATNGQVILTSETYSAKRGALNGIESVRKNSADESRFEKKTQKNGKFYFILKSGNQQQIGKSEAYETEAACKAGIRSVMKTAPAAKLDEGEADKKTAAARTVSKKAAGSKTPSKGAKKAVKKAPAKKAAKKAAPAPAPEATEGAAG